MSGVMARRPLPLAVAFPAVLVIFALASACGGDRAGRVTIIDGGPLGSVDPAAGATPGATGYPIGTLSGYGQTVEVDLGEWFVGADVTRLPAGTTRFVARNIGGDVHELVLIRGTSRDGEELVEIDWPLPGEVREIVHELTPGRYLLACILRLERGTNIYDHYDLGMHLEVIVD